MFLEIGERYRDTAWRERRTRGRHGFTARLEATAQIGPDIGTWITGWNIYENGQIECKMDGGVTT